MYWSGVYIFLKTWKTSPPPFEKSWKASPFSRTFLSQREKHFKVLPLFQMISSLFLCYFFPICYFLPFSFVFLTFFSICYLFFNTFPCEFSPSWKASPTSWKIFPPGGLFQENIRPWKKIICLLPPSPCDYAFNKEKEKLSSKVFVCCVMLRKREENVSIS